MFIIIFLILIFLLIKLITIFGTDRGFKRISIIGKGARQNKIKVLKNVAQDDNDTKIEKEVLVQIPDFNKKDFLKNCEEIFLETINAYEKSNHQTLKQNLSDDVYETFAEQIEIREKNNLSLEFVVKNIKTEIVAFVKKAKEINVKVKFHFEQMVMNIDKEGYSFDNPDKKFVPKINLWTFKKDLPNGVKWIVVET